MSTTMEPPRRRALSVDDYHRMADAGILGPDERVELIAGELIAMPPPGSLHAGTVDQLAEALRAAVGKRAIVRVQNPIGLDSYSEPQPDLALLRRRPDFYKSVHPSESDVLLIVEVADSSVRYDRDVKLPLYARHRIPEVWLLDLEAGKLARYRDPDEDRYRLTDQPSLDRPLEILALPGAGVDVAHVLRDR